MTALNTALGTFNAAKKDGSSTVQEAAAAFTAAHGATVDKVLDVVAITDKEAVNAAIAAYTALSDAAKVLLSADTPTKLQALLDRINGLGTANSITLDFKDDGALLDSPPANLSISRINADILTITAVSGLTEIQWSLGGVDIGAPRGTAQTIAIAAVNYPAGSYLLGFAAKKGEAVYSTAIPFTVTE